MNSSIRGKIGTGDICASHRGNSPSASPKPRRKISTSGYKAASPSPSRKSRSPALSRKSGASKNLTPRKSSEISRNTEENESILSFRPSPRTRKLYRFRNHFSDGASEDEPDENWLLEEKYQRTRKNGMILRRGGQNRINKLSMPEIIIQDFSDRDHRKMAKLKMRAVANFSNSRGISPEPVHSNSKRDAKAMAKLKMKALHEFSNGKGHHSPEPPIENPRTMGRTRNKIFALNSFRNGREITEYIEVSDTELEISDVEQFTDDEVEEIKKKNDDQKEINEPKDDVDIEIRKTDEEPKEDNIQMKETDKEISNNTTSALEVNEVFNLADNKTEKTEIKEVIENTEDNKTEKTEIKEEVIEDKEPCQLLMQIQGRAGTVLPNREKKLNIHM